MAQFDKIVQGVAEKLLEDERLRSNLADGEAKIVLDWALGWIGAQVNAARDEAAARQIAQSEFERVRQVMGGLNTFAKKSGPLRLANGVTALAAYLETTGSALSREQVLTLLTTLMSAAWQMRK